MSKYVFMVKSKYLRGVSEVKNLYNFHARNIDF